MHDQYHLVESLYWAQRRQRQQATTTTHLRVFLELGLLSMLLHEAHQQLLELLLRLGLAVDRGLVSEEQEPPLVVAAEEKALAEPDCIVGRLGRLAVGEGWLRRLGGRWVVGEGGSGGRNRPLTY